jgi:hypothetical protein
MNIEHRDHSLRYKWCVCVCVCVVHTFISLYTRRKQTEKQALKLIRGMRFSECSTFQWTMYSFQFCQFNYIFRVFQML